MGVHEINEEKRAQTKQLLADIKAKGWTVTDICLLFAVTSSCVATWSRGVSMARNDQRATRWRLPERASPEGRQLLRVQIGESIAYNQKVLGWHSEKPATVANYTAKIAKLAKALTEVDKR